MELLPLLWTLFGSHTERYVTCGGCFQGSRGLLESEWTVRFRVTGDYEWWVVMKYKEMPQRRLSYQSQDMIGTRILIKGGLRMSQIDRVSIM